MRSGVLVIAAATACSGPSAKKMPVTLAMYGDPQLGRSIRDALGRTDRFVAELVELPQPKLPAFDPGPIELVLARARSLYLDGHYAPCKETLAPPALVTSSLEAGRRDLAARVLLWRVTCLEHTDDPLGAAREAEAFAVFELVTPDEIGAVSREAQTLLETTKINVQARPRVELAITARVRNAAVVIDGARRCPLPCRLEVAAGDHLLKLESLGTNTEARLHHIARGSNVELPVTAADPAIAGDQWSRRFGSGTADDVSSVGSALLLRQAIAGKRLAVLTFTTGPSGALFGRLVDGQETLATVRRNLGDERRAGRVATELLDQLLVDAKLLPPPRPPIVRRWWFWTAVAGVATAATLTTYYFAAPRDVEPRITLR